MANYAELDKNNITISANDAGDINGFSGGVIYTVPL